MAEITAPACKLGIDSIDNAESDIGRLLLAAWDKGPSPAVLKSSSGFIEVSGGNNISNKQTTSDESTKDTHDNAGNKSTPENTASSSDKKEYYSHIYSILESFNLMRLVCEEDDKPGTEQSGNSNSDTSNNVESDTTQNQKQSQAVNIVTVKVGIKGVGYTEWKVAFRPNAIINSALNSIKKGKFKEARDAASKDLEVSGLVPLSAETYIEGNNVKKDINPPFIGHCNFAILAGAEDNDTRGDSELAVAITPYLASTLKPNKRIIVKAVYEILDLKGLTGGLLGEVALDVKNAVKDQVVGNDSSSRWGSRDDSGGNVNAGVADKLNEFLKKKFSKVSGNEERYQLYLSIAKFVTAALSKNYIAFKEMAVLKYSAENHSKLAGLIEDNTHGDLIWY